MQTDTGAKDLSYRNQIQAAVRIAIGLTIAASATPAFTADAVTPVLLEAQAAAGTTDVLAEVIVTARNRKENLQEVPLSISVVSGEQLEKLEATDLYSFATRAANISVQRSNQQHRAASIRGIGKMNNTHAQDPSVGIIVDGVNYAYNPLAASVEYTDVESLQVTRGPQGTLQGKNATLGVINITTRRPSFSPDANFSITAGENDTLIGRASGGGAAIDGLLAWRGSVAFQKGTGPYGNNYVHRNNDTYTNTDRVSGRAQLLLTPSQDFSARLSLNLQPRGGENGNGTTFFKQTPNAYADGANNPLSSDAGTRLARRWFLQNGEYSYLRDYLSDEYHYNDAHGPVVTGSNGGSVELNWKLGGYNLVALTSYNNYHFNARFNDEGTPFAIQLGSGNQHFYDQYTQEVRINSPEGGFIDYQAGLFAIRTKMDDRGSLTLYGADAGAWYASSNNATTGALGQYARLDADAAGRYLLQNSINGLGIIGNPQQKLDNKSFAAFGQVNWKFSDALVLTTGARVTREIRKSKDITSYISNQGNAPELNPASVNNVALGGFESNASTGVLGVNTPAQVAVADQVAQKYFNVATYAGLNDTQRRQVAAAKAIRRARIGTVWNPVTPVAWTKTQPAFVVSPSYKFSNAINGYVSWQYGEKAGIAQVTNGINNPVRAEKNSSYEVGVKSLLLDGKIVLNADVFVTDIKNYQQAVFVFDQYTTTLNNDGTQYFISATGNVPKVRAKGLELDGSFTGIPYTVLRFSGAYNDAKYRDFPNAGQPPENGNLTATYRDVSGETLPGASKYSFNLGADVEVPFAANKELRISLNSAYASRWNSDNTLSSYGWIPSSVVTDASVGIAHRTDSGSRFEYGILAKNVFDNRKHLSETWNTFIPADPRWVGLVFKGSF
jgi:iron complex outermembrane recepter protein